MANYTISNNTTNVNRIHDALIRQDAGMAQAIVESRDDGFLSITWESANTAEADIIAALANQESLTVSATALSIEVTPQGEQPTASQETTLTCTEAPNFDYVIRLDGVVVGSGGVEAGLAWSSEQAGVFEFEIHDPSSTKTKSISVTVTEES